MPLDLPRVAEEAGQIRDEELDAQREARRRLALAQIRQYPDPVLKLAAREVDAFDDALARLAGKMKVLMHEANGVGLAATQVGMLQRLFVFQLSDDETRALVNPRIVAASEETAVQDEGCLSLQGVLIPVERPAAITIEAQDETGEDVRLDLDELAARVAQHELDHLDGVLILDRTDETARRDALAILRPRPVLGAR